jgi:hypothetical protein
LASGSQADLHRFRAKGQLNRTQNFPGNPVSSDRLRVIWNLARNAVKPETNEYRFSDEPVPSGKSLDENKDLHPLVQNLIKWIQELLFVGNRSIIVRPSIWSEIKYLIPDIVVSAEGVTDPSWVDARIIVEMKRPSKWDATNTGMQQVCL